MNISAKQINLATQSIERELGVRPITKQHLIQGQFSDLIYDYRSGSKSGQVRTYGQVKQFRSENAARLGQTPTEYTEKEYKLQLKKLYNIISPRLTIEGEENDYRDKVKALFDSFNEAYGETVDIYNMPFDQLKRIVDYMDEQEMRARDRKGGKIDSPHKFVWLSEALVEEGLRELEYFDTESDDF